MLYNLCKRLDDILLFNYLTDYQDFDLLDEKWNESPEVNRFRKLLINVISKRLYIPVTYIEKLQYEMSAGNIIALPLDFNKVYITLGINRSIVPKYQYDFIDTLLTALNRNLSFRIVKEVQPLRLLITVQNLNNMFDVVENMSDQYRIDRIINKITEFDLGFSTIVV